MLIKGIFEKDIDRDIKGVIKVGEGEDENIRQELEEYVVTRELERHFSDFFTAYKKGINGHTDKMGVWISGSFGSGKSHFLKILSYLLENKEVAGKRALDYFTDGGKIHDNILLGDMRLAVGAARDTDVILFNIDSKAGSASGGSHAKDNIVTVFNNVFNEMSGFCGTNPYVADLERNLSDRGRYEEFKDLYKSRYAGSWESSRHKFNFDQDKVVGVLVGIGFMSEQAAWNWCETTTVPFGISIEEFANRVKQYIDSKGGKRRVIFMVDEMGQYITGANDSSKLMLNLQTVTEDLGTACRGKAWVAVTSQEAIDSITKSGGFKNNDFSKIQGRFDTRLSLSSANVDEVIKKRILEKNQTGQETLRLLYEQKATIIKNLIVFNDAVEKKLYSGGDDFSDVYPFVPYQFFLLGKILNSLRTHGASGKHLSEGERSMLSLFKDSAVKIKNSEVGAIVPFNMFYDALNQFLDSGHKQVISAAADNDIINPGREPDCFNTDVLKTLFLIKYIPEITANADNITSLLADGIDADRIGLKKRVEEALNILAGQMLVQKNDNVYVFLTDEEQEINRAINSMHVENSAVAAETAKLIFESLLNDKKYRHPYLNGRYAFAYNQIVDDSHYKVTQNAGIGVRVFTPNADVSGETELQMFSDQKKEALIVLPSDRAFWDELKNAMKIRAFLRLDPSSRAIAKYEEIYAAKKNEATEHEKSARLFLEEALKSADIYINGAKADIGVKDADSRVKDALGRLVASVYHKLGYIEKAMGEADIRALLKVSGQRDISLDGDSRPNAHALADMRDFIMENSARRQKTSMKTLMDKFMKAPYGFVEDDVEWLATALFKDGDITLTLNGEIVTLANRSEEDVFRYLTKKEYVEKLLTSYREKAGENQKKSARDVMKGLFGETIANNDDDALMSAFREHSKNMMRDLEKLEIEYKATPGYPGRSTVAEGIALLRGAAQISLASEFFEKIDSAKKDFIAFGDAYEQVKVFFKGQQKEIFGKALKYIKIYDDSKVFISDNRVETTAREIQDILKMEAPYGFIHKLPELTERFCEAYQQELGKAKIPVSAAIDEARARVLEKLAGKSYEGPFSESVDEQFAELTRDLEHCDNVATVKSIGQKIDTLKINLLDKIAAKDAQIASEAANAITEPSAEPSAPESIHAQPVVKRHRNISIKTLSAAGSWQIETADDVDKHIAELRRRLINELSEDTVINIEF